jgi:hypothetical protein
MKDLSKALFEGNTAILHVAIANPAGEVLTVYPYGSVETGASYAARDYFIEAVTSKKSVTSDLYETSSVSTRRKTVVVAVPVLDKTAKVIGVIVGSLDLDKLGNKLQQIASGKTNEYFVVVDRAGQRVIHSDHAQVGTQVDEQDPVRLALAGRRGTTEGYSNDGIRTLVAYDVINDTTNWAIAVKAPIADILKATNAASITTVSVVIISMFMTGTFLLSHRARSIVPEIVGEAVPVVHEAKVSTALEKAARGRRKKREKGADTS